MFDCASSPPPLPLSTLSKPFLLIPPPRRRIPANGPLFFSGDLLRLTSGGRRPLGAPSSARVRVRVRSDLEKNKDNDDEEEEEEEEVRTSFDFLELKREMEKEEEEEEEKEELVPSSSSPTEEIEGAGRGRRRRRQVTRRSSLLAKQVISVRSARSLGFVSQLWVDTRSWMVVLVEVRPNLLSGEVEKFLLEDLVQVGDVVLVQDESVMENELKMTGLDTLVRGYTFNINSGVVESLELDSFGFSIIPASLVSTYSLLVDNVLEVASDTVVLQEGAVSRVQRVTKGIWHNSNVDKSDDNMEEYYDFGRQRGRSAYSQNSRNLKGRRFPRKRVAADDWELPMDY